MSASYRQGTRRKRKTTVWNRAATSYYTHPSDRNPTTRWPNHCSSSDTCQANWWFRWVGYLWQPFCSFARLICSCGTSGCLTLFLSAPPECVTTTGCRYNRDSLNRDHQYMHLLHFPITRSVLSTPLWLLFSITLCSSMFAKACPFFPCMSVRLSLHCLALRVSVLITDNLKRTYGIIIQYIIRWSSVNSANDNGSGGT